MSAKNSIQNYKFAGQLFKEIDEAFNLIDQKEVPSHQLDKLSSDVRRFEILLNKISIQDIADEYPKDSVDKIKQKVDFFYESAIYIKKTLLGRKYYDAIIDPVKSYISRIYYGRGDKNDLAKKFSAMLTHQDNVMIFLNQLKRMAVGTMSDNEFRKIYQSNKQKMIGGTKAFESENKSIKMKILTLEDYKNNNLKEDFYNPFDEVETDKKPTFMSDKGGMLKSRKETFNINRVEYTKRTNGQYTMLSKDMIAKGEIVEICPVIACGIEAKAIDGINDHIFEIDKNERRYGLVLGYGSLYQHSEKPNLEFGYNKNTKQMYFTSLRMIKAGEELTIDYGKDYWDERKTFNTLAPMPQPEKPVEESGMGLQGNANDMTGQMRTQTFGSPTNPANPAISGVAIQGPGQS